MKVKVISSRHSHIQPGMIGIISEEDSKLFKKYEKCSDLEVTFIVVPPYGIKAVETTVMMERKELEAVDGN